MRLYLDTNILVFLLGDHESLDNFQCYASLPFIKDHRDPFDRLIIAQAISDKATLVSSDLKFQWYEKYGLDFVQNKR